jgi:UDP-2,3-diacylglucosamine pyrophosphatase LpxH
VRTAPLYAASIEGALQKLLDEAPAVPLGRTDRIVIVSDLHLGDGGPRDDFRQNAALVQEVLRRHYLDSGYSLVLNGDIEELQRFRYESIRASWENILGLFGQFRRRTALYRIIGNHDESLPAVSDAKDGPLLEAVRFTYEGDTILLFHGHQATIFFERFNGVSGFFLRHVANRLRIHNFPVMYESQKKYLTEHRVYSFSTSRKVVSIIGHTHRPLFESLSKIDTLRFRIEQLCRDHSMASPRARAAIETAISSCRAELERLWEKDRKNGLRSSLYSEHLSIPCLFNSGCAIGKRGFTAIEIAGGQIALVHWFDRERSQRHMSEDGRAAERLGSTSYYRAVLKQDRLQYVFTRIRLLT